MPTIILLTVLGAWLGYANPWLQFPPAMLLFPLGLAWIGCRATSGKKAFSRGWLAAALGLLGCLYWITWPVTHYGGVAWYLSIPAVLLLCAYLATHYGLWVVGMHYGAKRLSPLLLCLYAGVSWTALEHFGSWFLGGFPWVTVSAAFSFWPEAVQGVSLVGAYGLSGVFACLATACLLFNTARSTKILAIGLTVFLVAFGIIRVQTFVDDGPEKTIVMIQGDIDQGQKWAADYQQTTVDTYERLTLLALEGTRADLVMWPETAMPFYLQDLSDYSIQVREFVTSTGVPHVIGSPAYGPGQGGIDFVSYNRMFLVEPSKRLTQWYDKIHLVPFGEYVPFGSLLPVDKLAHGIGDYLPGTIFEPMRTDSMALGGLTCYEAIFPYLAQDRAAHGADILINISNDAWFGGSSAPWQHLSQAVLRCVEQARWLARDTNNGITVTIDPLGHIRDSIPQFQASSLTSTVKPVAITTIYHALYPLTDFGSYALTALAVAWMLFSRRRTRPVLGEKG